MDFFSFLENTSINDKKSHEKIVKIVNDNKNSHNEKIVNDNKNFHNEKIVNDNEIIDNQKNTNEIKYKKGDNIVVVYLKNSKLNTYKGYNGLIKSFHKNQALVILDANNETHLFKLEHIQLKSF